MPNLVGTYRPKRIYVKVAKFTPKTVIDNDKGRLRIRIRVILDHVRS